MGLGVRPRGHRGTARQTREDLGEQGVRGWSVHHPRETVLLSWSPLRSQKMRPGKSALHQCKRNNMNLQRTAQAFLTESAGQILSGRVLDREAASPEKAVRRGAGWRRCPVWPGPQGFRAMDVLTRRSGHSCLVPGGPGERGHQSRGGPGTCDKPDGLSAGRHTSPLRVCSRGTPGLRLTS